MIYSFAVTANSTIEFSWSSSIQLNSICIETRYRDGTVEECMFCHINSWSSSCEMFCWWSLSLSCWWRAWYWCCDTCRRARYFRLWLKNSSDAQSYCSTSLLRARAEAQDEMEQEALGSHLDGYQHVLSTALAKLKRLAAKDQSSRCRHPGTTLYFLRRRRSRDPGPVLTMALLRGYPRCFCQTTHRRDSSQSVQKTVEIEAALSARCQKSWTEADVEEFRQNQGIVKQILFEDVCAEQIKR
jgi:hypothetical protein